MPSIPAPISPGMLRSDLYSIQDDDQAPPLVISVLASLLERAIARTRRAATAASSVQCGTLAAARGTRAFDSHRVLDMSIQSFLERIFRYARVGPAVYVVAYVYVDRLCQMNPGFHLSSANSHRLLITTIMVASKFIEDLNFRNSYFAKVGGVTTEEMNKLEVDFLFLIKFKLHVNVSVFQSYCSHLEREVGIGGGYHIERTLRSMCGGEEMMMVEVASKERERERERRRRECNQQLAKVL